MLVFLLLSNQIPKDHETDLQNCVILIHPRYFKHFDWNWLDLSLQEKVPQYVTFIFNVCLILNRAEKEYVVVYDNI